MMRRQISHPHCKVKKGRVCTIKIESNQQEEKKTVLKGF